MTLVNRFDPPAFLPDYNSIPGQLEAWHQAVSTWFDAVVKIEQDRIGAKPQYYNPSVFDPGGIRVEQSIVWNAFPKEMLRRYGRDRALQLADVPWPIERYRSPSADPTNPADTSGILYRPQEEYCEWHVVRDPDTNAIKRITFTSEPPEYWQALFGSIPGGDGIPDVSLPGSKKTLIELYHDLVSEEVQLQDLVAQDDIKDATGRLWISKGEYNIYNKWNTKYGIAHLNAPPNSLVAEIQLGGDGTVLRLDPQGKLLVEPDALICYANYGGPNRNSDPTIGAAVNALARLGAYVTLANPVGLYMDHIDLSGWEAPDNGDITDFVRIVRGSPGMIERLVIEAPTGRGFDVGDLTIAGTPIRYAGQVAECITVKLTGVANIVPKPVETPAIAVNQRASIDPNYPSTVSRPGAASDPLPPGTVEAFLREGVVPGVAAPRSRAAKRRTIGARSPRSRPRHLRLNR